MLARRIARFLRTATPGLTIAFGLLLWNGAATAKVESGFGVTAAVYGSVQLHPARGAKPLAVDSGKVVAPGDRLVTGKSSGLQVLLTDNTVFTLGSNTDFSLDRYTYDAATAKGGMKASLKRGLFKLATGRIGEARSGAVSVEMPTSTLVMRGTVALFIAGPDQDQALLLGPGARRRSQEKQGSFVVIPKGAAAPTGDNEIVVFRAGFGVTVDREGNVSRPFEIGDGLGQILAGLAPGGIGGGGDDGGDDGRPAGALAGDDGSDGDDIDGVDDIDEGNEPTDPRRNKAAELAEAGSEDATENDATSDAAAPLPSLDGAQLAGLLDVLDGAQLIDLLGALEGAQLAGLLDALDGAQLDELLDALDETQLDELLDALDGTQLAGLLDALDGARLDELLDALDGTRLADLLDAQAVTRVVDLEDIAGLEGRFVREDIEMENGGTFDLVFEFGRVEAGVLDFLGFVDIDTATILDGEISFNASRGDTLGGVTELALSLAGGTLTDRGGCADVNDCTASITVLDAGQGNIAKFFVIDLDNGDDTFTGTIVKPGGNHNFPDDDPADIDLDAIDDVDAFVAGLDVTRLADIADLGEALDFEFKRGIEMGNGDSFEMVFEVDDGALEKVGFEKIRTQGVKKGEISLDADIPAEKAVIDALGELVFSHNNGFGNLVDKGGCAGDCVAGITIRNGNGDASVARFVTFRLKTGNIDFAEASFDRRAGDD